MWIKWQYSDHGSSGWHELELRDGYPHYEITNYLIDHCAEIPSWSERFMRERIKWEIITKTPAELVEINRKKIQSLENEIEVLREQIYNLQQSEKDCSLNSGA